VNDWFITLWQGAEYHLPLLLQTMFALNLAITSSGEAALQVPARYHMAGLRLFGLTAAGAGLLNLALSLIAVKAGYLVGIGRRHGCGAVGFQLHHEQIHLPAAQPFLAGMDFP